jgi:hypothetical protein
VGPLVSYTNLLFCCVAWAVALAALACAADRVPPHSCFFDCCVSWCCERRQYSVLFTVEGRSCLHVLRGAMQADGTFVKVVPRPLGKQVAPLITAIRAKLHLGAAENGLPTVFVSSAGRTFVCLGCSVAASSVAFLGLCGTSINVNGMSFSVREWKEQQLLRDPTVVLLSTLGCGLDELAAAIYNSDRVWTANAGYAKPSLEVLRGYLKHPAGKEHVVVACPDALRTMLLTVGSFMCNYTVVQVVDPSARLQHQEGANSRAPSTHGGDQRFHEIFQRLRVLEDAVEEHTTAIATMRVDTNDQLSFLRQGIKTLLQRVEPAVSVRSPTRNLFGALGSAELGPEASCGNRPALKTAGGVSPARFGSSSASGGAKRQSAVMPILPVPSRCGPKWRFHVQTARQGRPLDCARGDLSARDGRWSAWWNQGAAPGSRALLPRCA